jgi:hypothetical protein
VPAHLVGEVVEVALHRGGDLADEDRRTIARWIYLGCPLDLDFNPRFSERRGFGWMLDDNRPIITLTSPRDGANEPLDRILIGMHDYYTGLDLETFVVATDFAVDDAKPGDNLADRFKQIAQGVWELRFAKPVVSLPSAHIVAMVQDRQGNLAKIDRRFSAR